MATCANYKSQSPELFKKSVEFNNLVKEGTIEKIRDRVAIRAPQLNGCKFCLDKSCLRNTSALLPDRFLCKQPDDLYERGPSEFKQ
jgi:alkylhydroperoxidase family enzyme